MRSPIISILPFLILSVLQVSGTPVDSSSTQSPSEEFYSRGWQLLKNFVPPINVVTDLYQSLLNFRDKGENEIMPIDVNQRVIHPNGNTDKCLSAATNNNGVPVVLTDCTGGSNPPPNQLWTVTGGTFQIFGNKCLDSTNGVTTNGQTMQIYDCYPRSRNQQWTQIGGSIQLSGTSKCLDNISGTWRNDTGNPAQLSDCYDGPNQMWSVVLPSDPPPPPRSQSGMTIRPGKSGSTCLSVSLGALTVTVQPCGGAAQIWTYSDGYLHMLSAWCLQVPPGQTQNGVKVEVAWCHTGRLKPNQQFEVTSSNQIIWKGHNKCLDLSGGKLNPGNRIQMWDCSPGHPNQVWNFV